MSSSSNNPTPDLLDHEYDGIRELDNPVPGWWHLLFWASIVFAVPYFIFYQWSPVATSVHQAWEAAQAAANEKIFGKLGEMAPDEPTMLKLMHDPELMAVAKGRFASNCAQCHGREGGGINGVNLTDNVYKNVKSLGEVYTIVTGGANNGAMPAWSNRLTKNERILLSAYAASLRGTNVPGGRAAEGAEIPPWPQPQ